MEIQPGIHIHLGDCLEVMKEIPDQSIDMVMADLPYGTTACEWDSVIPLEPLWSQYKRIIKPRGAIVLTASQPFTTTLITSNIAWFKHSWIWNKRFAGNFVKARFGPLKIHEDVVVFSPLSPAYYPQMTKRDVPIRKGGNNVSKWESSVVDYAKDEYKNKVYDEKVPESILEISSRSEQRGHHSTQKPVALMEYLIRTYTNEGELVLDNTMGSGTTGIACIRSGRNFIGIEKDPDIFEMARQRLTGDKPQITMIDNTPHQQARLF